MSPNNKRTPYDPNADTQPFVPGDPLSRTSPILAPHAKKERRSGGCCLLPLLLVAGLLAVYFLAPLRTNVLLLGADRTEGSEAYGRTDTIILTTVVPLQPYVGMLSIPRDLWVPVPGYGENRINTAHYFAELKQPGSGPQATAQVIENTFRVNAPYYVRIRFSGFKDVINAMGGVTINLATPASGLSAGEHRLDGDQALAFVRERYSSDDFFRMAHGQLLLKAAFQQMLNPTSWPKIPAVAEALSQVVTTNLPVWLWPRLGLALLRVGPSGIDSRTVNREMVTPFITSGGADVLRPNWDKIRPVVLDMYGVQ